MPAAQLQRVNYYASGIKMGKMISGTVIGFFKGLVYGSFGFVYGIYDGLLHGIDTSEYTEE